MHLDFRFAVISDLHVALPHTVWNHPQRLHLVEVSIPALERVLAHLCQLDLAFLLLPGDLTQHGEPENHAWLAQRLAQLPFPVYVIPGNHDIPVATGSDAAIHPAKFPEYYRQFGYQESDGQRPACDHQLYYTCKVLPGVRLIGLNSNQFDRQGQQLGRLGRTQLQWLEQVLAMATEDLILVMIHHNVVEHLPGQARHPLGRRYMLRNAPVLLNLLQRAGVQLVFSGHLHVQDIACTQGIYDITTGSLVSYPHPYRILEVKTNGQGQPQLQIQSECVASIPGWPDLQQSSRELMGDRSIAFMHRFLTEPPLNLSISEANRLAPSLRYFWATIAAGNPEFHFPNLPQPLRDYFENFSTRKNSHADRVDANQATITLNSLSKVD